MGYGCVPVVFPLGSLHSHQHTQTPPGSRHSLSAHCSSRCSQPRSGCPDPFVLHQIPLILFPSFISFSFYPFYFLPFPSFFFSFFIFFFFFTLSFPFSFLPFLSPSLPSSRPPPLLLFNFFLPLSVLFLPFSLTFSPRPLSLFPFSLHSFSLSPSVPHRTVRSLQDLKEDSIPMCISYSFFFLSFSLHFPLFLFFFSFSSLFLSFLFFLLLYFSSFSLFLSLFLSMRFSPIPSFSFSFTFFPSLLISFSFPFYFIFASLFPNISPFSPFSSSIFFPLFYFQTFSFLHLLSHFSLSLCSPLNVSLLSLSNLLHSFSPFSLPSSISHCQAATAILKSHQPPFPPYPIPHWAAPRSPLFTAQIPTSWRRGDSPLLTLLFCLQGAKCPRRASSFTAPSPANPNVSAPPSPHPSCYGWKGPLRRTITWWAPSASSWPAASASPRPRYGTAIRTHPSTELSCGHHTVMEIRWAKCSVVPQEWCMGSSVSGWGGDAASPRSHVGAVVQHYFFSA